VSVPPRHCLSNGLALLIIFAVNAGAIGWAGYRAPRKIPRKLFPTVTKSLKKLSVAEPSDSVLWFAAGPLLLILALQAKAWRGSRPTLAGAAVAEHEKPREP
jgi:hypothetical protein